MKKLLKILVIPTVVGLIAIGYYMVDSNAQKEWPLLYKNYTLSDHLFDAMVGVCIMVIVVGIIILIILLIKALYSAIDKL